ncbi:MAG TPA: type VI secretion system membrane subunit TssM [Pyrinomonadaceae bacterium]|nr:type VI secretion system membrane subunit TssM [Pyrinomonadaceae bacterium]
MSWQTDRLKFLLGVSGMVSFYGITLLAIGFLGTTLGVTTQIVLIALVLLTIPFTILIAYYRKRRGAQVAAPAAAAVAPAAQSQAAVPQNQKATHLPPVAGTYEEITRGAEETVQWLRGTKLSGARADDAVYALPWFMLAGLPSSGKTSLLLSSGLDFHPLPSQRPTDQNTIRPTVNCEWRVTDSAILIDTTGRYQTEGGHRDEWAALFETIKRHRKARPIDGLVLAVSAATVLRWNDMEIEQQAKILRARLDEAMLRAQARFPIYLVFTHVDQIEGFAEFFQSFTSEERAQVWGSTFPLAQGSNAHALFDAELDHLYGRLLRRRMAQLGVPVASDRQLRIFKFPGHFRRTRNRLGLFISALFRPNPFSESPLLRGFYFTSSTGVGSVNARRLSGQGFFAQNFFRDVLLRDKDIVAAAAAKRRHPQRWRNLALAGLAVLLLTLFVGMVVSFFGNKALIAEAKERADELERVESDAPGAKATSREMAAMERLRETLSKAAGEGDFPPFWLRFGLYSGGRLNADESMPRFIYFESVDRRFLKPTVAMMEQELEAFGVGKDRNSGAVAPTTTAAGVEENSADEYLGRQYDLLKAYLMIAKADKVEPTFLVNELRDRWKSLAPPDEEETTLKQLEYYASQAHREVGVPHHPTNPKLVERAQERLVAEYPVVERVYKGIVSDINKEVKPVKLNTISGAPDGSVLTGAYTVPGSYTLDGYRRMTETLASSADEKFRKEDWVMQRGQVADEPPEGVEKKLSDMYYRRYAAQWQKFLSEVKVPEFKQKEQPLRVLKILAGSDGNTSPLESLLGEVVRQTTLSAETGGGFVGWVKNLFASKARADGIHKQVEKEFAPLIEFVERKDDTSKLQQYLKKLKSVGDKLQRNTNKSLADIAKAMAGGKDPLDDVRAEIDGMLEPMSSSPASEPAAQLLKQPLNNLYALLVNTGTEQLNKDWQPLYARAQTLEAGFPFKDGPGGEVSVEQLASFLNPQDGELTRFFNTRLKSFFEEDWSVKQEHAGKFSPDFVNYLKNARRLREELFPGGAGKQPNVEYVLAIVEPVPNAKVRIEIDGNVIEPDTLAPPFKWPGNKTGAMISVTPADAATADGEVPKKPFPGEWGVLKMFTEGGGDGKAAQANLAIKVSDAAPPLRLTLQPKSGSVFQRELFTALRAPKSLLPSR